MMAIATLQWAVVEWVIWDINYANDTIKRPSVIEGFLLYGDKVF